MFYNICNISSAGDRTGRIHIGYNQALYVAHGQFPSDLAVYRGGEATMQGELQVIGVTVSNEGILKNMQNISIVAGGRNGYITVIIVFHGHIYHKTLDIFDQMKVIYYKIVVFYICPGHKILYDSC
jgi:hypothetical protein